MRSAGARPARVPAMARLAVRSPHEGEVRAAAWWPWLLVAAAIGWNLVSLRALTLQVTYLNDSSLHEQMVRFATAQLCAGHLPLSSWFPFLGEGSPQFLHYQSPPAMVTGLVGLATGPDVAFRWSLYLLLSLWPVSVYLAARAFGAGRPAAAASAAMAPFLVSITGVGYEQHAYLPTGFGVWTQLWASWTLPLAWGWSWRAIRDGRGYFAAVLLTALTVALHFETGYLALAVLLIWPLVAGRPLVARLRRAAVLLGGSLLASAWVIVPLVAQRKWAASTSRCRGPGWSTATARVKSSTGCTPGSPRTVPISASSTGLRAAGMAGYRRRHASPRPVRSARNAPTQVAARPRRRCRCAVPESWCSAPRTTLDGRPP